MRSNKAQEPGGRRAINRYHHDPASNADLYKLLITAAKLHKGFCK